MPCCHIVSATAIVHFGWPQQLHEHLRSFIIVWYTIIYNVESNISFETCAGDSKEKLWVPDIFMCWSWIPFLKLCGLLYIHIQISPWSTGSCFCFVPVGRVLEISREIIVIVTKLVFPCSEAFVRVEDTPRNYVWDCLSMFKSRHSTQCLFCKTQTSENERKTYSIPLHDAHQDVCSCRRRPSLACSALGISWMCPWLFDQIEQLWEPKGYRLRLNCEVLPISWYCRDIDVVFRSSIWTVTACRRIFCPSESFFSEGACQCNSWLQMQSVDQSCVHPPASLGQSQWKMMTVLFDLQHL